MMQGFELFVPLLRRMGKNLHIICSYLIQRVHVAVSRQSIRSVFVLHD
jgi:hypothetical protein